MLKRGNADSGLLDDVLDAKREAMQLEGPLESVRRDASFTDVAGLKHLREWVAKRRSALTPEGRRFGLAPPKGVLISGVQGCGKSLAARAVAGEWGVELARLDVGALYDKYVGESEKRLHKALELAEKLAPIVLWIDEIEKAFASAGASGDADAGLSQRLLATFLTWMQDREGDVFLAATSNNITILPPEMTRKGRFDEIFFVDLPGAEVRAALFTLHLKKARKGRGGVRCGGARGGKRRIFRSRDRAGHRRGPVHGVRSETTAHNGNLAGGNPRHAAAQRDSRGRDSSHKGLGEIARRAGGLNPEVRDWPNGFPVD